jgi:hypothetical protein
MAPQMTLKVALEEQRGREHDQPSGNRRAHRWRHIA